MRHRVFGRFEGLESRLALTVDVAVYRSGELVTNEVAAEIQSTAAAFEVR